MYTDTIDTFVGLSEKKAALLRDKPLAFFLGAMGVRFPFWRAGEP